MINQILNFWIKNRMIIVALLLVLLMMNLCGRILTPLTNESPVNTEILENNNDFNKGNGIKSYEQLIAERVARERQRTTSFFSVIFWLSALVLVVYYLNRRGWLPKLMPQWVSFRMVLMENRINKRLLMRLTITNNSRKSETFNSPCLLFKKWSKSRKFVIKNDLFPLTLTPETTHTMMIDVQNFYDKVSGLNKFKWIGAEVENSGGKVYRSIAVPRWWVFKRN